MARNGRFSLSRLKDEYGRQREAGSGRGRSLKRAYRTVKSNPRKVAGKSTTLKNMASVTVTKLPNGVVKITGRKMAGKRNPYPTKFPRSHWYEVHVYGERTRKLYESKREADKKARELNREDKGSARVIRVEPRV